MCDVMPTISEDSITQQPNQYNVSNNFKDGAANFEQLMVNITYNNIECQVPGYT